MSNTRRLHSIVTMVTNGTGMGVGKPSTRVMQPNSCANTDVGLLDPHQTSDKVVLCDGRCIGTDDLMVITHTFTAGSRSLQWFALANMQGDKLRAAVTP